MRIRSALVAKIVAGIALTLPVSGETAVFQQYFAVLDAGNELDGGHAGATGIAMVMFGPKSGQLCFAILVRDMDTPTAAHIHDALAGSSSGVFVGLVAPSTGNPGSSAGCVTTTSTNLGAIKANPTKFYVNVHGTLKSGGALRGQLF
jgi:hypothetical protein